jgi:Clostripain family
MPARRRSKARPGLPVRPATAKPLGLGSRRGDVDSDSGEAHWTVLVYMGVDTEAGNVPMLRPAIDDLAEMAAVGSGGPVKIYVQAHTANEVRRGRIDPVDFTKPGAAEDFYSRGLKVLTGPVNGRERATVSGAALAEFVAWALHEANHRPTDRLMLVLWGHAYEFAVGARTVADVGVEALDFVQLGTSMGQLQEAIKKILRSKTPPKLDIIAFDACDVATAEILYELSPYADYLLASQVGVPLPGWPYDEVLERLAAPVAGPMTPTDLGTWIINRFCARYAGADAVSLSMLNLSRAGDLADRVKVFASQLRRFILERPSNRDQIGEVFLRSITEFDKPYVDVADVALNVAREVPDVLLVEAARALGNYIVAPLGSDSDPGEHPFIVAHGICSGSASKLNGVSLYSPHVASEHDSERARKRYKQLTFNERNAWDSVVYALLP